MQKMSIKIKPRRLFQPSVTFLTKSLFTWKKKVNKEEVDINTLVRLSKFVSSLGASPLHPSHPVHNVAKQIKENIESKPDTNFSQVNKIVIVTFLRSQIVLIVDDFGNNNRDGLYIS